MAHAIQVYEELRKRVASGRAREPSAAEISVMSMCSKAFASVVTYPPQVVRSRLQQRREAVHGSTVRNSYADAFTTISTTFRNEGIGGFYRGLNASMLRVLPQAALTFLTYEYTLRSLII